MTGLSDNNGNDFIRGLETRACVNGMTKSDVERLKNALVKKILDDETVIDVTEDGSIVADSNGMFISVNGQLLGLSVDGDDVIPVTEPYLPEDANENPLAPPNDTIMTSANIGVDPRIVHTTGNETIAGIKNFENVPYKGFVVSDVSSTGPNTWRRIFTSNSSSSSSMRTVKIELIGTRSTSSTYCVYHYSGSSGEPTGVVSNANFPIRICRRADNGNIEVWTNAAVYAYIILDAIRTVGSVLQTTVDLSENTTEPQVGDVYTYVSTPTVG